MFELASHGAIDIVIHGALGAMEDEFVESHRKKITQEIVKDEGARKGEHDDEHHKGHHDIHLGSGEVGKGGLVDILAGLGVGHQVAEAMLFIRGLLLLGDDILDKSSNESAAESEEIGEREIQRKDAAGVAIKRNETEEDGVEIIGGLVLIRNRIICLIREIRLLKLNNFGNFRPLVSNKGIGTVLEIGVGGGDDHDANGREEGDENRELDENSQNRAEGVDVVFFVQIHGLERLELLITVRVLANLNQLGLDFLHEAGLEELFLRQRIHEELH